LLILTWNNLFVIIKKKQKLKKIEHINLMIFKFFFAVRASVTNPVEYLKHKKKTSSGAIAIQMTEAQIKCCFIYLNSKKLAIVGTSKKSNYEKQIERYMNGRTWDEITIKSCLKTISDDEKESATEKGYIDFIFAKTFNSITVGIVANVRKVTILLLLSLLRSSEYSKEKKHKHIKRHEKIRG
ncbi:hypothetical protein RFI_24372, partial [Reticulomyxa filosa]